MEMTKNYLLLLLLLMGFATPTLAKIDAEALFLPPTSIALDDSSVVEKAPIGTIVGILFTTDPDANDSFVYELSEGEGSDDNRLFTIEDDRLLTDTVFNYEDDSVFTIQITSTDLQGEFYTTSFAIKITKESDSVNQAPTNIILSDSVVAENAELGTGIGFLSTEDADDDGGFTYRLVGGDGDIDNASFRIDGAELITDDIFDFEARSEYRVRIEAIDPQGNTFGKAFTITVIDVPEANPQSPTNILLSNSTIAENQADTTPVGTLSSVSPNEGTSFVYNLVAGDSATDNGSFIIEGDQLLAAGGFDFETQSTLLVRIQTADLEGNTFSKGLLIAVEDVDETQNQAPTAIILSNSAIAEEQPINTLIGTFMTEDPDDSIRFTYVKVAGEGDVDNASFRIVDDQLFSNEVFDFETKPSYQLRVRTTDQVGASFEQMFTITVEDFDEMVNQPPTDIQLSNTTIAETTSVGSLVGVLSTTDLDDQVGFEYALTAGEGDTDNASFQIADNELLSSIAFDFETKDTYQVRITTTDPAGATFTQAFTIQVTDVIETENQPPSDLILSDSLISENEPIGTEIGYFAVIDADVEDRHAITLVEGAGGDGNGSFRIRDKALVTNESFDFESQSTYSIRVQAKDSAQGTVAKVFIITVTDRRDTVNQLPSDIYLLDTLVSEGVTADSVVSTISVDDADTVDAHTLALVSGEGDDDNRFFSIRGNLLLSGQVFDYETQDSYRIRVRADDQRGGMLEKILTIRVAAPNAPPELANALPDLTAEVGTPFTYTIPEGTFTDPEGDTLAYTMGLADGAPLPGWLIFERDTRTLSGTPPKDTPDSLLLEVTATDLQDSSATDQVTLTITREEVVTAVEAEVEAAWTVYPVPTAQREVTLRGPLVGTPVQLRLLDTRGRLLRSYTVGATSLSEYAVELPATLSTGAYFLEIETPETVERKRIILQ